MFILTRNRRRLSAARALAAALTPVERREWPVFDLPLPDGFSLSWFKSKPADNLHVFRDGVAAGKIDFSEPCSNEPVYHEGERMPTDIHPLLHTTLIRTGGDDGILVRPNEQNTIYYSQESVSDSQLLLARTDGELPDPFGVLTLAASGFFPGHMTLFSGIRKIPYLETLRFPAGTTFRHSSFTPRRNDDRQMIERLQSILPAHERVAHMLSGGIDSRFVLGILLRRQLVPKIYYFMMPGNEDDIVRRVCDHLGLDLQISSEPPVDEYLYTVMSDGRIYFRGGNYSRMINTPRPGELLYNGMWSDPIIENTFKSAWKKPGSIRTIYDDLIWYALLSHVPAEGVNGLTAQPDKQALFDRLREELAFGKSYCEFNSRKAWSCWFYHIHRGINWTNPHMADVSHFVYPVYMLADKTATEFGITSTGYANFCKDRLRLLNRRLMPDVPIDYSHGRSFNLLPPVARDIYKLYYEFPKRFIDRYRGLKQTRTGGGQQHYFDDCRLEAAPEFDRYFSQDLPALVADDGVHPHTKRAAITVNNVLRFLDTNRAEAGAGAVSVRDWAPRRQ